LPTPTTKIHQLHYFALLGHDDKSTDLLAISTEDGRILFYSSSLVSETEAAEGLPKQGIPLREAVCQLGGAAEGLTGRFKDFEILKPPDSQSLLVVTGSSDGAIRVWLLDEAELTDGKSVSNTPLQDRVEERANGTTHGSSTGAKEAVAQPSTTTQVGTLLGTYEAGNRITCLKAFIMSKLESSKKIVSVNGSNGHLAGSLDEKDSDDGDD